MIRALCILLCLFALGCGPRGETRSLDEVLNSAKQRLAVARKGGSSEPESLAAIIAKIESIVSQPQIQQGAALREVGVGIGELVVHAGHTSRPALNEISLQYLNISNNETLAPAQAKLLAARTYLLFASELETNQFRF